jgi:hypothetical protein
MVRSNERVLSSGCCSRLLSTIFPRSTFTKEFSPLKQLHWASAYVGLSLICVPALSQEVGKDVQKEGV